MRPRAAEVIGDKPPKESIRAVVIFGSAEDAETFCVKACGARLKGRLPFFGIKTAGQLRYPSGRVPRRPRGAGGAEGVAQAGDEDDDDVFHACLEDDEALSQGSRGVRPEQAEVGGAVELSRTLTPAGCHERPEAAALAGQVAEELPAVAAVVRDVV